MHKAFAFGALAALAFTGTAFAENGNGGAMSYDYLEGQYISADYDDLPGSNPDGFGLAGSIGFSPMLHGYVDYDRLSTHGITIQGVELGLGLNYSVSSNVDLIGRVGFARAKVENFGSDNGFGVQAGVRARVVDNVELESLVHYTDFGGSGGDNTSVKLAGRYFFSPQFSAGIGVELDNDVKLWDAGFRWTFN